MLQKARRQGLSPLRPVVSARFQILFHSPRRGSFHLSITVLVRYRSSHVFSLGEWSPHLPAGLACPAVLFVSPDFPFAYRVLTFFDLPSQTVRLTSALVGHWAPPLSLATTRGIFSFPQGTEMFQFPHLPPVTG